jgi:oligopeptidase A
MKNPLLEKSELPRFGSIKAEHVVPAIKKLIHDGRDEIESLLDSGKNNWHELVEVVEEVNDNLSQAYSPVSHMNSVVNTPEIRDAYNEILPLVSAYHTELGQNKRLFDAYLAISGSDEFATLDIAQKKALENAIRDFHLSGIDLGESDQQRFSDISKRLSELSSQFSDNVLDATMAWSKLIADESELAGLPNSSLNAAAQLAEQKGHSGYLFTLDFPSYFPVLSYCENRNLRQEMYEAYVTRASDKGPNAGEFDNSALMIEILSLKQEQAGLLGFANFAEMSLATKMARDTSQVSDFLSDLAAKAKPKAVVEFAEICDFALDKFGAENIEAWDVSFYAEKLKEAKFNVSEEALKPYFPANTVLNGMFEVVHRLFDIDVIESQDVETWHEDVKTYDVVRDESVIARFYLDLYARENKQGGAWMDDCRVRRVLHDGNIQLPVAYLTCNFSGPVGDVPALLTHDEVVTLFHEFGHGLHHMMTRVQCASVSGINGVAWDAVELPSQLMENWCWQPEALAFISGHYETGEPLPIEMLDNVIAAKNFQSAMMTVRQLEFATFDFTLHSEFDPQLEGQILQTLDQVRESVAVVPAAKFNRFPHAFSHIFGGGYAAGYYSYKWAEVLSADAFEKFESEGIFNRQTGEKYLSCILEVGGSVDAMDMFVAFRGREPQVEALLRQDGIL